MKRRRFLQAAATLAVGIQIVPRYVLGQGQIPPSEKLNIAGVGIGGQGGGVLNDMKSENIVALCDVDWAKAAGTFQAFPNAERFKDYRVMLEKRKDIDAVMVATPDHMHAPIALAALRAGKHVYVEKPMAHSIEEARVMTKVAQETGLVTQMGNNGHAGEGLRLTREWIQAGAIGAVREVHGWSDRAGNWWKQPVERPVDVLPVPADLDWDLWLGCAPQRPYHKAYHPFAWRGWFDFGTGRSGTWPCTISTRRSTRWTSVRRSRHRRRTPAWARKPTRRGRSSPSSSPCAGATGFEDDLVRRGQAAAKAWRPRGRSGTSRQRHPVHRRAGIDVMRWLVRAPGLFPASRRKEFQRPPKTIPRSSGHRAEWIQACKDRKPADAKAGFAYSGPFTEALLVGNLAVRLQKRVEWDSANLCAGTRRRPRRSFARATGQGSGSSHA